MRVGQHGISAFYEGLGRATTDIPVHDLKVAFDRFPTDTRIFAPGDALHYIEVARWLLAEFVVETLSPQLDAAAKEAG